MEEKTLLKINNLTTSFRIKDEYYAAVDDVSIELNRNEILAIVGESGCGKSTLATAVIGLHNPINTKSEGEIIYKGKNLLSLNEAGYNEIRGNEIGMIFQDPLSALNPLMRVEEQIEEGLIYHTKLTPSERKERVHELLQQVGIPNYKRVARQFPHELSGGMRQRAALIRTLAVRPELLLLDEPFSALDYQTRLFVSDEIGSIIKNEGITAILVTHDISEAVSMSGRVVVMSSRPASIKSIHKIVLTCDKNTPMGRRSAPEFREYFNQIWRELDIHV